MIHLRTIQLLSYWAIDRKSWPISRLFSSLTNSFKYNKSQHLSCVMLNLWLLILQCCYFFKQAQFYKETGEKRTLFQQKRRAKNRRNSKFSWKKTGILCDQAPAVPWVPHWAGSLLGGYPSSAAQEGMTGARLSLLAPSGERENMFNYLCFNFNLFLSWTYTNITKHSHHFELLVLVHM